ncbi:GNAT family N-acetyltransferase [Rhodanobacter hydrolyticus]
MTGMGVSSVPELETARLRLRAHRPDDHDACTAMWADPAVVRYIGGRPFTAEETWRRMLGSRGMWSMLGFGYWAVEEKAGGRYVGDIGFGDFRREIEPSLVGMLEFGWVLSPQAHGHGYASEAIAAATAWADVHLPDMRAVCLINEGNAASIRVAAKAGFREWQRTTYHGEPALVFAR